MANRTLKDAKNIHGTNPQYLIEKIIRSRIYDSQFWKESCFALTAELMVDKAMELRFIGGVYGGNIKPTPFICLVLKFLQIQPEKVKFQKSSSNYFQENFSFRTSSWSSSRTKSSSMSERSALSTFVSPHPPSIATNISSRSTTTTGRSADRTAPVS